MAKRKVKYTHRALMELALTAKRATAEDLLSCIAFEFAASSATWYYGLVPTAQQIHIEIDNWEGVTLAEVKSWLWKAVKAAGWKKRPDYKWGEPGDFGDGPDIEPMPRTFYIEAPGYRSEITLGGTAKRASIRIDL